MGIVRSVVREVAKVGRTDKTTSDGYVDGRVKIWLSEKCRPSDLNMYLSRLVLGCDHTCHKFSPTPRSESKSGPHYGN